MIGVLNLRGCMLLHVRVSYVGLKLSYDCVLLYVWRISFLECVNRTRLRSELHSAVYIFTVLKLCATLCIRSCEKEKKFGVAYCQEITDCECK